MTIESNIIVKLIPVDADTIAQDLSGSPELYLAGYLNRNRGGRQLVSVAGPIDIKQADGTTTPHMVAAYQ